MEQKKILFSLIHKETAHICLKWILHLNFKSNTTM
uniref:Uncharacterized protein n=1 Tax=Rhizophora mucronata TaxID=61149 RepID=A0A2P2NCN6_RHIMU